MENIIERGSIVTIPFKKTLLEGVVFEITANDTSSVRLKNIASVKSSIGVDEKLFSFIEWFASYHRISRGHALTLLALSHPLRNLFPRHAGAVAEYEQSTLVYCTSFAEKQKLYHTLLKRCIKEKKPLLFLCPTLHEAQLLSRALAATQEIPIIPGSPAKDAARTAVRFLQGEILCAIGTRNAVLLPHPALGTIVFDQAERNEFKNNNQNPRYDARTAARQRSAIWGTRLVFISAAPRLQEYALAQEKKIAFIRHTEPQTIRCVNLSDWMKEESKSFISKELREATTACIACGNDVLLFLNRRGMSGSVVCGDCEYTFACPVCSQTLAWSERSKKLRCAQCKAPSALPPSCPSCKGVVFRFPGIRVEKVILELRRLFPDTQIHEITRGAVSQTHTKELRATLEKNPGKSRIFIGTTLVISAFPELFSRIKFLGIVSADPVYTMATYQSVEGQWQVLANLIYRAHSSQCAVLLQTFNPDDPFVQSIQTLDYEKFASQELASRKKFLWPPFSQLILCIVKKTSLSQRDLIASAHTWLQQANLESAHITNVPSHRNAEKKFLLKLPVHESEEKIQAFFRLLPLNTLIDRDP